ncbi:MAG: AI-2E family transporter [Synergistaceae bacterium]|jgi:predicted PurR-regulated permease PerM|nr:AI-2E family transporter [Synergistaceae bacterium]
MEKKIRKPTVTETCLVILAIIAVGFVLSNAERVAIPLTLAFILTLLFTPVIKAGEPYKIPPFVMVIMIIVCFFGVFLPLGIFLNTRLQSTIQLLPTYHSRLVGLGRALLERYQVPTSFLDSINWYNTMGRYLSGMTGFMLNWLGNLVMVMVFLIFMLLESPYIDDRLKLAFKGENGDKITLMAEKIVGQISKYLRTLALISLSTGTLVWGALSALKIEFAMTWGILAFIFNFVPTVGSIAASLPPVLVAIVQYYPDPVPAVLTFLALLAIQFTMGNILTPKIMGDTLGLSPVVILISLMFWGLIWGITGALLSVPLAVMIKIICENIEPLHFMAVLMSSAHSRPHEEVSE